MTEQQVRDLEGIIAKQETELDDERFKTRQAEVEVDRLKTLMDKRPTTLSPWDRTILERGERAEVKVRQLKVAVSTLLYYLDEFNDGQSVKTYQRLGMASSFAYAVLEGESDPMKAVRAAWSDRDGLVTHFTPKEPKL